MKRKVSEIYDDINKLIEKGKALEDEYNGKLPKGEIYHSRLKTIYNKIKALNLELSNIGKGVVNKWVVFFIDSRKVHHKEFIWLDGNFTKEDITEYYEIHKKCIVELIEVVAEIKLSMNGIK